MYKSLLLLCTLILLSSCQAEKVLGIKKLQGNERKKCKRYIAFKSDFPVEEQYYIHYQEGMLYLAVTHPKYMDQLFQKKSDGFAVDIIKKEQYDCKGPNELDESWANNGTLLPPLFKKDFPKARSHKKGVLIPYRKLPEGFDPSNIEYNLIIAQKKWHCDYLQYTNLERSNWSLLPTGLYRDSIPENVGTISEEFTKSTSFTLFFEQDQSNYDSTSLKPFYDSLNLTDFKITDIYIDAFASVEGNTDRNKTLLEERAKSMFNAMQAYQSEKVNLTINTQENWHDFLSDIKDTSFASLADLSKREIKNALNTDKALLQRIQPILELHRKAKIRVNLTKRFTIETNDPEVLKGYFKTRLKQKNLQETIFIQQAIFEKIKGSELPETFLEELKIPKSIGNLPLLNNKAVFKYQQDISGITEVLNDLLELQKLKPDSPKIQFNIIALKTRLWQVSKNRVYGSDLKVRLDILKKSQLNRKLITRLEINYLILLTDYYHNARQYKRKNASLSQILDNYRATQMTDEERLGLAYYLIYYSRYQDAKDILRPRALREATSSDILFTYLGYVLVKSDLRLKDSNLLRLIDRAIVRDSERFCQLFAPLPQGGISFQLLEDEQLKSIYCDECNREK